jgi:hypothetical protein
MQKLRSRTAGAAEHVLNRVCPSSLPEKLRFDVAGDLCR